MPDELDGYDYAEDSGPDLCPHCGADQNTEVCAGNCPSWETDE